MAPELHLKKDYDGKKYDLFSAGIILFMMLTARPPFGSAKIEDTYYKYIATKNYKLFWEAHQQFDKDH